MKNILYTIMLSFLFSFSVFADWNSKILKEVHYGCTNTDISHDTFGGTNRLIQYCDCFTYNASQAFTVSEAVRLMESGEMESNDKFNRIIDYCIKLFE